MLAWRYGLDFKQLADWNGLRSPYKLSTGQQLRLNPPPTKKTPASKRTRKHAAKTPENPSLTTRQAQRPKNPVVKSQDNPELSNTLALGDEPLIWLWPIQGDVIKKFSPKGAGKKGIDIAGVPGQSIKAASPGKVVYSGSGLLGYGQLIIIKHNTKFLSAYAHNRRLTVKEGEQVKSGQKIAELGMSGTNRPKLHFEIRRNGQPVDPLVYLPKRR